MMVCRPLVWLCGLLICSAVAPAARRGLQLYNGTLLRNVPISTTDEQAGIVAWARLLHGNTPERTATEFCNDKPSTLSIGASIAECTEYLTTAFTNLYAEETQRRLTELSLLSVEQSHQVPC